ncbi:hypothetical protein PIB30_043360 [Stylosanthes scabra]|uniref:Uncharacterized protein n=1 Tax=Stylosanthes scabra TaxID=79078 RepID=A0ABU6WDU7_9FABA|nr:hypothetical protein [Stylosanthes scabra]
MEVTYVDWGVFFLLVMDSCGYVLRPKEVEDFRVIPYSVKLSIKNKLKLSYFVDEGQENGSSRMRNHEVVNSIHDENDSFFEENNSNEIADESGFSYEGVRRGRSRMNSKESKIYSTLSDSMDPDYRFYLTQKLLRNEGDSEDDAFNSYQAICAIEAGNGSQESELNNSLPDYMDPDYEEYLEMIESGQLKIPDFHSRQHILETSQLTLLSK